MSEEGGFLDGSHAWEVLAASNSPPETTAVASRGRQCPRNLHVIAFQAISLVHAFNSALQFTETLSITVIVCNYIVHTIPFHEEAGQIA